MRLKRGAEWYTTGLLLCEVYFPEGEVCCGHCPQYDKYNNRCVATGENLYRPQSYIGRDCPIQFEGGEADEISEP